MASQHREFQRLERDPINPKRAFHAEETAADATHLRLLRRARHDPAHNAFLKRDGHAWLFDKVARARPATAEGERVGGGGGGRGPAEQQRARTRGGAEAALDRAAGRDPDDDPLSHLPPLPEPEVAESRADVLAVAHVIAWVKRAYPARVHTCPAHNCGLPFPSARAVIAHVAAAHDRKLAHPNERTLLPQNRDPSLPLSPARRQLPGLRDPVAREAAAAADAVGQHVRGVAEQAREAASDATTRVADVSRTVGAERVTDLLERRRERARARQHRRGAPRAHGEHGWADGRLAPGVLQACERAATGAEVLAAAAGGRSLREYIGNQALAGLSSEERVRLETLVAAVDSTFGAAGKAKQAGLSPKRAAALPPHRTRPGMPLRPTTVVDRVGATPTKPAGTRAEGRDADAGRAQSRVGRRDPAAPRIAAVAGADTTAGPGAVGRVVPAGAMERGAARESKGLDRYVAYQGTFADGAMDGLGAYAYGGGDGGLYVGSWRANVPSGAGAARYPSGATFVGQHGGGRRDGQGTFALPSGLRFEGEWAQGRRAGFGVQRLRSGLVYEGSFVSDNYHGQGRMRSELTGWEYVGEWVSGCIEGYGSLTNLRTKQTWFKHWPRATFHDTVRATKFETVKAAEAYTAERTARWAPLDAKRLKSYVARVRKGIEDEERRKEEAKEEERRAFYEEVKRRKQEAMNRAMEEMLRGS